MVDDPWVQEQDDLTDVLDAVLEFGIPNTAWDEVTFDIYEDYATGATVAVPSWLEVYRAAQASNVDGSLVMYVGLSQGETFDEALDFGAEQFIRSMHSTAAWDSAGPFEDLEYDVLDEDAEYASGWGVYASANWDTGYRSELNLKVAALENVFLNAALYIHDIEREFIEDSEFEAMMRIAAAYLSDFAID